MPNQTLFATRRGRRVPPADLINEAGGTAYAFTSRHALAQIAATGCLNGTFYASAEDQFDKVLDHARKCDPEFVAKVAVYARREAFMKDMPALLCALLATRGATSTGRVSPERAKCLDLLARVAPRVLDNMKMVRNFVQFVRSGTLGRKSLGTAPQRVVQALLGAVDDETLFRQSVGATPSLGDVIKMARPKPATPQREALYRYLIGKEVVHGLLPAPVQAFEAFKKAGNGEVRGKRELPQGVPFEMLAGMELTPTEWKMLASRASWTQTRMNLNTFARHGVFEDREMVDAVANKLRNQEAIEKARVFPYQLMAAYMNAGQDVPDVVRRALHDAMEYATRNVPEIPGKVYVCPDVSGSMSSPVTGHRKGSTSKVRVVDVAALFTSAILRRNPTAEVIPFEIRVRSSDIKLDRGGILDNAARLSSACGGGTACSAPLELLNKQKAKGDLVVYISDYESWVDFQIAHRGTAMMEQWAVFKQRNPQAKLVCIDVQPYEHTQAQEREDILNVGGFSDNVFKVVTLFAQGGLSAEHWVGEIEKVEL